MLKNKKPPTKIAGGVTDAITGVRLEDVSIYEINSLESTLTDASGSFELKAKTGSDVATFLISKEDYKDTIIQITNMRQLEAPIILEQEKESKLGKAIRDKNKGIFLMDLRNFSLQKRSLKMQEM